MKLLVVDDHPLLRAAVQGVVARLEPGAMVLAVGDSEREFAIADAEPDLDLVADAGKDMGHIRADMSRQRFYRGRSAEGTAGSGLGLALARNIARLHPVFPEVHRDLIE